MTSSARIRLAIGLTAAFLLQACSSGGGVVYDPYAANYQQAGRVDSYSSWESLNDRGRGSR